MSKHRQAAKIDANQNKIVNQLRQIGFSVQVGMDDVLVGHNGKTFWFEIKDPAKVLKKDGTYKSGSIKPSQYKLLNEWNGHYQIVHSIHQIIDAVTMERNKNEKEAFLNEIKKKDDVISHLRNNLAEYHSKYGKLDKNQ